MKTVEAMVKFSRHENPQNYFMDLHKKAVNNYKLRDLNALDRISHSIASAFRNAGILIPGSKK